jgi:predicted secreted protein
MKKRIRSLFVAVVLLTALASSASAADNGVYVTLDGNRLEGEALIKGETLYLPVRPTCQALGYQVRWSDQNGVQTVAVTKAGHNVLLDLTNQKITDNSHSYYAVTNSGMGMILDGGNTYLEAGLFSSLFAVHITYEPQNNRVALQRICENDISITNQTITGETDFLKTTIQYPKIGGLADDAVEESVNALIWQAAQNAQKEGEKNAAELERDRAAGYGSPHPCETYFDYHIEYNQAGMLSIVLLNYQYTGGAHGSTVQSSYTFDLATGAVLELSDLMKSGVDFRAYFNQTIRREINRRVDEGVLTEFDDAKFKDIGEHPGYYLSNNAVVIYFQQYEYFPYAAGIQEFPIAYTKLANLLKDEYWFLYSVPVVLKSNQQNSLAVGDVGKVSLFGNPTTGYSWHYRIENENVLKLVSECYSSDAGNGVVGAGGTFQWVFRAMKAGETSVTFKYYRDWEGEEDAIETAVYKITVQ